MDVYLRVAIELVGSLAGVNQFESFSHAFIHVIIEDFLVAPTERDAMIDYALSTLSFDCAESLIKKVRNKAKGTKKQQKAEKKASPVDKEFK